MESRIITVVLSIEDQIQANAIWSAHMNNTTVLGAKVNAIATGDILKERDQFQDTLEYLEEKLIGSNYEQYLDVTL